MKQLKRKQLDNRIVYWTNDLSKEKTILFLHPAFATHEAFNPQFEYFTNRFNIIALDLAGHGESQALKSKDKVSDTAAHIKAILDIEKISSVHLVGCSIGALLAQDFANKFPESVKSLTSLGGYDINNYDPEAAKSQNKEQIGFMFKALVSMEWFSRSNARISAYTESAQKQFYQMNLSFKRRSFAAMTSLSKIMNQTQVPLEVPTLIACGEHDAPLAITLAERWHEHRPETKMKMIPDAGHCAQMDNPLYFNKLIERFIEKL